MTEDEMAEDARFGAAAGHSPVDRADDYGFFAPVATAAAGTDGMDGMDAPPAPFGTPPPFGAPVPPPAAMPARSGLPARAIALITVGGMLVVGIATWVALPAFLDSRQHSRLADTSVAMPPVVIGLARSADPAIQSQVAQLATDVPSGFTHRRSAAYVGDSSTLLVVAAKPKHVLTLAEQESLTRSFWAQAAASVPDGSSLAAPSTPPGAGATGTLTCADELTADGTATVCVDAQATALVVFVLASSSDSGSDPTAPAQVPPALVHAG
jgi:hypothetical protein